MSLTVSQLKCYQWWQCRSSLYKMPSKTKRNALSSKAKRLFWCRQLVFLSQWTLGTPVELSSRKISRLCSGIEQTSRQLSYQARLHTSNHLFTEIVQIFQSKYVFSKIQTTKLGNMSSTLYEQCLGFLTSHWWARVVLRAYGLTFLSGTGKFNCFVDIIIKAALSLSHYKTLSIGYNIYTLNIYKLFAFDISSGPSKILKSKISHIEQVFSAFHARYNLWEIN